MSFERFPLGPVPVAAVYVRLSPAEFGRRFVLRQRQFPERPVAPAVQTQLAEAAPEHPVSPAHLAIAVRPPEPSVRLLSDSVPVDHFPEPPAHRLWKPSDLREPEFLKV